MRSHRILIIEDSTDLAESLRDLLEMHGHTVSVALTGTTGIATALAEKPDLILLDIRLPDMNGYAVFQHIRLDSWGATAKITILTASDSIEAIAKNIRIPVEHVLFKPDISISEVIQKVEARLLE